MSGLLRRLRRLLVERILGLRDTPHRIAWGVLLGFLVAWTPTIGFQIAIYVALATLLRANKVAGIPILFISNPATAVPLYYGCWRVGAWLMHLGVPAEEAEAARIALERKVELLLSANGPGLLDAAFWSRLWEVAVALGGEVWVGSLLLGLVTGVPGYALAYWGVREYRRRYMPRRHHGAT